MEQPPMLKYMRKVLDEHTIPLEDMNAGLIEAVWLLLMIDKTEKVYKANGF
jgi:hypothetical protein